MADIDKELAELDRLYRAALVELERWRGELLSSPDTLKPNTAKRFRDIADQATIMAIAIENAKGKEGFQIESGKA